MGGREGGTVNKAFRNGDAARQDLDDASVIRVAIVDEEINALATKTKAIDSEPDLTVIGTGSTAADAVQLARDLGPEVVMLDLPLSDASGATVTRSVIESRVEHTAVLAVTNETDDDLARAAIRAGAAGVCTNADPPEILAHSVRSVASGDAAISPPLLKRLLPALLSCEPKGLDVCSPREVEVLDLIGKGATNPEIAKHLYISETTVRSHVQNLRTKLGVRNRVGLVVLAHKSGLTSL